MATRERVAWIFHEKARNHHCLRRRRAIAANPKPPRASASNKTVGAPSPVLESTFSSPGASGASGASTPPDAEAPEADCPLDSAPLLRDMHFREGGPARNRAFFIKSGGGREKSVRLPGNRNATDLALCLQVVRGHTAQGGDGVFRGLPVDEFRPISGRSPLLFCHGRSQRQRLLGRAACRAEQPRVVGDARRTCRLPQSRARAAPRGWRRASNHRAQSRRCVGSRQPARSRRRWSQIVQAGVGRRSPRPDAVGQNDDIARSNTAKHLFTVSPQTASVVWGNAD